MTNAIERPIFIVGSGRSGTTIFSRLLAGHRGLGWFCNYMQRFGGLPLLASLHVLYQTPALVRRHLDKRWLPKPDEARKLWDQFHPVENPMCDPPLTEKDVAMADTEGMRRFIANVLRFSRRARFMNKNTRNTRRSRYLHAIFPDALFIHVIRDGRAVTNSFINVDWWSTLSIWWADGKTPTQLQQGGTDPLLVAAHMWESEVARMLHDKEHIPEDQYMEIRYEKLTQDPIAEMKRVLSFCDLPWTQGFQAHVEAFSIENRNFKWADRFTAHQIASIEKEIGPLLEQLEYL